MKHRRRIEEHAQSENFHFVSKADSSQAEVFKHAIKELLGSRPNPEHDLHLNAITAVLTKFES